MPDANCQPPDDSEPTLAARRAHWDRRAKTYDTDFAHAPIRWRVLDEIFSQLPRTARKTLDAGTGSGRTLARLLDHVDPCCELVGTDISEAMLKEARGQIQANRPGALTLVNADNVDLPFPTGEFDLVLSTFTLHHIPPAQQLRVLREFRRVLNDGGTLALADQVQTNPPLSAGDMRMEIGRVFYPYLPVGAVSHRLSDYGEWPLQPAQLKELLNDAGFDADITLLEPIVAVVRAQVAIGSAAP